MRVPDTDPAMEKIGTLSQVERAELLSIVEDGFFAPGRAIYWPRTSRLLTSKIYCRLEELVASKTGSRPLFLFDELFLPTPQQNFHEWHKDMEDQYFQAGCRNIWIPLFSSLERVAGLEVVRSEVVNAFDHLFERNVTPLPIQVAPEEMLALRLRNTDFRKFAHRELNTEVVDANVDDIFLLDSGCFHRAIPTSAFQIRFGIKFALSPMVPGVDMPQDVQTFALAHRFLSKEFSDFIDQPIPEQYKRTAVWIHEHIAAGAHGADERNTLLFRAFLKGLR